jgi:toxin ParE1/3/4
MPESSLALGKCNKPVTGGNGVRVEWLESALLSLNAEADYIGDDNPDAADRFIETIFAAVDRLTKYPASGRPGRVLGTRELVVSGTPYIVPYRIRERRVEVLLVLHGARKWPKSF